MMYAGLVLTALLGWAVLPRRLGAGPVSGPALGFGLVAFGVSLELFVLDAVGVGVAVNPWLALAPWVAAAGWTLYRERPWKRPRLGFKLRVGPVLAWAGAAVAAVVWLPLERRMPLTSQTWDAWAIWLFKAQAFFVDGRIGTYLERAGEFVGQPGYPLLTPLYSTFLYRLAGQVDPQTVKIVSPVYFFALLAAFYYLVRRIGTLRVAGAATAMLALTVLLARASFDLAGYAEATLAFYLTVAAGFFYLWLSRGRTLDFAAACLAATAAAWTKNEGLFFLAGFGLIAAAHLVRQRRPWAEWLWLVPLPAALFGTYAAMRVAAGVEASGFSLIGDYQPELFGIALGSMLGKAFDWRDFQLTFPLLLAAIAGGAALRARLAFWTLPALVLWQMAGALLAYASGRNEIQWWLETSADRLLAQVAPLCLLAAATAFSLWDAKPSPPVAVRRAAAKPKKKGVKKKAAKRRRKGSAAA